MTVNTILFREQASQPPLPTFENVPVLQRRVRFSGKAVLDLTFETDIAFLEGLRFGQEVEVTVRCTVVRKGYVLDETGETEECGAIHDYGLRVDQVVL